MSAPNLKYSLSLCVCVSLSLSLCVCVLFVVFDWRPLLSGIKALMAKFFVDLRVMPADTA